ncbi:MAG: TIGR03960 family B12-binding radical SAM protein [Eubacteriales bacterium]|nr:TIGR03960 family B12-binding radical SAM protein [Eubacteriales bacterium]
MDERLKAILARVKKPARYAGGEYGAVKKDPASVDLRIAFCFPDSYEIGMSHLGLKLLYALWNAQDYIWCERSFAPWPDMEAEMRGAGIPLYALESGDPLSDFDIIGFTLQYELCYTNVLNMLDLAGLPVYAKDRHELKNLVVAGGPCVCNAEPIADFIDLFMFGEGEEVSLELFELYRRAKAEGWTKKAFLRSAADIPGIYVPCFYDVTYRDDGAVAAITPQDGVPAVITKRIVEDFDRAFIPEYFVVPSTEVVHDRVMVEVMRGCIRGCRFCQAGYTWRPVRSRRAETIIENAKTLALQTGYEEISLISLSSSDHREIDRICDELSDFCRERKISLALPSQRADSFTPELYEKLRMVRQTGLTFAPEAGSARLRDVINKNLAEEDLMNACKIAFSGGADSVKLYFMAGLPTETDEDLLGIPDLARKVTWNWRQNSPNRARGLKVSVSVAGFVPKPHTPFQWAAQTTREEFQRKYMFLKDNFRIKNVTYNWHEPAVSFLEGVFARGDRRLGKALHEAWKRGCKFDAWGDFFNLDTWLEVFRDTGLDPAWYANRERPADEVLPWSHMSCGVTQAHLWREYQKALAGEPSPDCRTQCTGCGALCLMKGGKCDA